MSVERWLLGERVVCPFCLAVSRQRKDGAACRHCGQTTPVVYFREHRGLRPLPVQAFGWSQHGKTVFLTALTLMLSRMSCLWSRYTHLPATEASQRKVQEVNEYVRTGHLPPPTPLGADECYLMLLRGMDRWGGRALVYRDTAGELFDAQDVPLDQVPFLKVAPVTFMLVSLDDLKRGAKGRTPDLLLANYLQTLLSAGVDFAKPRRRLIVVFTKGDVLRGLPPEVGKYLRADPFWAVLDPERSSRVPELQFGAADISRYLDRMRDIDHEIRAWFETDAVGKNFVRLAENQGARLRFTVISSTGGETSPGGGLVGRWYPRRVLDPLFWALDD